MRPKKAAAAENTALATVEPDGVEVLTGDPQWDRARKLRDEVKQAVQRSIDSQVMLGGELLALKTKLGFKGSGRRKEKVHDVRFIEAPRTWDDWCQAELGISRVTADRFINCYKLIHDRARRLGEDSQACRLLGTPANELADADYKAVSQVLRELVGEQSQTELLREFGLLRRPKPVGGDTSAFRPPTFLDNPTPEQAALFLSSYFANLHEAARLIYRHRQADLDLLLTQVPFDASGMPMGMGLMDYKYQIEKLIPEVISDLEEISTRLGRFVAARTEGAAATARKSRRSRKSPTKR